MSQSTKLARARAKKYSFDLSRYYRLPSTRVSLSMVLSLFVVTFFVVVALKPTFVTIAKLNTEIEESEKTLKQLNTKSIALEQAAVIWEKVQPVVPYLEASIPQNTSSYENLTKSIEVLAKESGVEVTSLVVGKSLLYSQILDIYQGREREVIEMELTIRVVGKFGQSLAFLKQLLSMDRLIAVTNLTINKETATTDNANVGMAITGTVQYLANPKQLDKVLEQGGGK